MKIDSRQADDIQNKIERLSQSYTPEWHFDREDPDIGSAIARLFAMQMDENITQVNHMVERYHAEFVNMLDLSLKPARASGSVIHFNLIENTVPGTQIRKGTRLQASAQGDGGAPVLFETDRDLYVTNSKITDVFMTDREEGSIVPIAGHFEEPQIVDRSARVEDTESDEENKPWEEEEEEPVYVDDTEDLAFDPNAGPVKPFVLFSEKANIAKSVLILYHETMFDVEDEPVFIRFSGNEGLIQKVKEGEYFFQYYSRSGFKEFDEVNLLPDQETFSLKRKGRNQKIREGARKYSVVILSARHPVTEPEEVSYIGISSTGGKRPMTFVNDGTADLNPGEFDPFTDTLSQFNECYIGMDEYFSKGGSKITVTFHVTYHEHGLYLTKQEEEVELKVIKKKPKLKPMDEPAIAYADEIVLEYFNGLGWKKLPTEGETARMFEKGEAADLTFSFTCPSDWKSVEVGADSGRCIRMRLLKADNCYLRPAVHYAPCITGMKAEYTYEGCFMEPQRVFVISGTERREITSSFRAGKPSPVLSGTKYHDDALYLGFDRRIEEGPASIYFELEDLVNISGLSCRFEYSTLRGFKRMKTVDFTGNFSRSGSVIFVPSSDMQAMELEGRKRYWIRVVRSTPQREDEAARFLPKIRRILTNVVSASNIFTGPETNYYLNEPEPGKRVFVGEGNILDAEVWVNERGNITREEIERMVTDEPDRIRVEYDIFGTPSSVFVLWTETDSFLQITDRRCYMIDRLTNEVIFSDGMRADIPRVTDDIAFKVRIRSTDGEKGNVQKGTITETVGTELFVDSVTNLMRSYGGSDMETISEALRRGANILYGRNKLVTVSDYIWTILNYSDTIDKVACISGETIDGIKDPSELSFVLLMKDFEDGSFSFHRISGELKEYMLEHASLTLPRERVHIVEPLFVYISVTVWAELTNPDDSFETQNMIRDMLKSYFNPVAQDGTDGWDIGEIPKRTQIMMRLGTLKSHAIVRKTSIIARYTDRDGGHEVDIANLPANPFMVVRSGKHHVQIIYK
ncbi:MAG: hypothetical protein K6F35_03170 [Lachnospiraceae bacterium]|nr:hypothetical protein [Lachnospiraceae bacterium]